MYVPSRSPQDHKHVEGSDLSVATDICEWVPFTTDSHLGNNQGVYGSDTTILINISTRFDLDSCPVADACASGIDNDQRNGVAPGSKRGI